MNIYIFPQRATEIGGYGIVVKSDYELLDIDPSNDKVIWYANQGHNDKLTVNDTVIPRPGTFALKRFYNVFLNRPSTELFVSDLPAIKNDDVSTIFCGDTLLYRALRKSFPEKTIVVRFHNCFYRINERVKTLGVTVDLKYRQLLFSFSRLESQIFSDDKVIPIFLCKEDQQFYKTVTGKCNSKLWSVQVNTDKRERTFPYTGIDCLVYFGSVATHKRKSLDHFIDNIFPRIQIAIPSLKLYLYGAGTEVYNKPEKGVFGNGWYETDDFPHKENGLYINPDMTGGGVKIKIKFYLEENLRFLTTPFGFEGYSHELIDNTRSWLLPIEAWEKGIPDIIDHSKQT